MVALCPRLVAFGQYPCLGYDNHMRLDSPSRFPLVAALLCVAALAVAGCAYHMPIQQGNYIDPDTLAKVKAGMTRTQVRYLLGTPMVPGAFDDDRWDYDYYLRLRRGQKPRRQHATVYFSDDRVARIESHDVQQQPVPVSSRPVSAPAS